MNNVKFMASIISKKLQEDMVISIKILPNGEDTTQSIVEIPTEVLPIVLQMTHMIYFSDFSSDFY